MPCKSCQYPTPGTYCPNCGQKSVDRFSWKTISAWIGDEVFVLDKGFFFTLKELMFRPVGVVNHYLEGATKKYYNPLKLLLIVTAIPFVIVSLLPGYQAMPGNAELLKDWPDMFAGGASEYFLANFPFFLAANFFTYFLITIPCWSLFAWLFFRRRKLNYVEHLIFLSYLASGTIAFYALVVPVFGLLFGLVGRLLSVEFTETGLAVATGGLFLFSALYVIRSFRRFYNESFLRVAFKGLFMGQLGVICSMLTQFVLLSLTKLLLNLFS